MNQKPGPTDVRAGVMTPHKKELDMSVCLARRARKTLGTLLREMSGLECKAMFENAESSFVFNRCLRQGSVEAGKKWPLRFWLMWKKNG